MNRRNVMMMAGMGVLAAAVSVPEARAIPSSPVSPPAAPPDVANPSYIFQDEFDGPAGSGPDPSKWFVVNFDEPVYPPIPGHYRDDRRNVFVDGNSNLVLRGTQEGTEFFSGKVESLARVGIGHTFEARMKLDCLVPGCWPAYWLLNRDPLPDGEIDVVEWYGNDKWAPGSTVHARSDGKTWEGRDIPELVDPDWHTWRVTWDDTGFRFWRDYVDGAQPYLTVPPKPIKGVWPFNNPGYMMFPIFSLAIGGPGGGDPNWPLFFTPSILVDWIRVW